MLGRVLSARLFRRAQAIFSEAAIRFRSASGSSSLLNFVGAVSKEALPCPRHHVSIPVDVLPLAILQQVYNKTADFIFWCLGQINRDRNFLHHPVSFRHLRKGLGVGFQYVSLQRYLGS